MKYVLALLIFLALVLIPARIAALVLVHAKTIKHQPVTVRLPPPKPAPPSLSALALAQRAATRYWGGEACNGIVTIRYGIPPTNISAGGVSLRNISAWTGFDTPYGPENYNVPTTSLTNCVITFNRYPWGSRSYQARKFPLFCGIIVHEYGELFGHKDSAADPQTSITYPRITGLNEHVPPCVAEYGIIDS